MILQNKYKFQLQILIRGKEAKRFTPKSNTKRIIMAASKGFKGVCKSNISIVSLSKSFSENWRKFSI